MSDYEDNDYGDEQKYGMGKGDYDRISNSVCNITNIANIFGKNGNNTSNKNTNSNIERSLLSEKDKMCLKIEGFSRYISDTFNIPIENDEIREIVNYLDNIKKPIHTISSQTLVLAHLFFKNKDILGQIINDILPTITDVRIVGPDIIRYFRMIEKIIE